jgi:hypothetical protein
MIPLTVTARGNRQLSPFLKQTAVKGVCVIAAHQYLRAQGEEGFTDHSGKLRSSEKGYFEKLGSSVIEYYLSKK